MPAQKCCGFSSTVQAQPPPGLPEAPALEKVPGVFVVGDAASVVCDGRPVPGVARAAIQERRYVGRLIARQLKGREPKHRFRYYRSNNCRDVVRTEQDVS